eukprot:1187871-Prorocentrum_minimum.AAC.1
MILGMKTHYSRKNTTGFSISVRGGPLLRQHPPRRRRLRALRCRQQRRHPVGARLVLGRQLGHLGVRVHLGVHVEAGEGGELARLAEDERAREGHGPPARHQQLLRNRLYGSVPHLCTVNPTCIGSTMDVTIHRATDPSSISATASMARFRTCVPSTCIGSTPTYRAAERDDSVPAKVTRPLRVGGLWVTPRDSRFGPGEGGEAARQKREGYCLQGIKPALGALRRWARECLQTLGLLVQPTLAGGQESVSKLSGCWFNQP